MQGSFPTLTSLHLGSTARLGSDVPDSFLGGSAPLLHTLWLYNVPFAALSTLLLSATDLVHLYLGDITESGYILPETMITCLSVMTGLETLHLRFHDRHFFSYRKEPPPRLTPLVLPTLTSLNFRGASEYFEKLITKIAGPLLDDVTLMVFGQLTLRSAHFLRFVYQAVPKLNAFDQAGIAFCHHTVGLTLFTQAGLFDCKKAYAGYPVRGGVGPPLMPGGGLPRALRAALHLGNTGYLRGFAFADQMERQRRG